MISGWVSFTERREKEEKEKRSEKEKEAIEKKRKDTIVSFIGEGGMELLVTTMIYKKPWVEIPVKEEFSFVMYMYAFFI